MKHKYRYSAIISQHNKKILHWDSQDHKTTMVHLLYILEQEKTATEANLFDRETGKSIFSTKKDPIQ